MSRFPDDLPPKPVNISGFLQKMSWEKGAAVALGGFGLSEGYDGFSKALSGALGFVVSGLRPLFDLANVGYLLNYVPTALLIATIYFGYRAYNSMRRKL